MCDRRVVYLLYDCMKNIENIIISVLKKYHIKKAALFGSYARGDFHKKSDVDILFVPPRDMSLFEYVGVKQDLEAELGKEVDLVSYRAIRPIIKESILKDEHILYEER